MKKILSIVAVILIVLICFGIFLRYYNTPERRVQRQLEVAEQYLLEEKYEEAVIAFGKVIDIDDRCVDAYLGIAKAYAELECYEEAEKCLSNGYEKTQDERIEKQRLEIYRFILLPLSAEELSWIVEPIYTYHDIEPIYGDAFSDIGMGKYAKGEINFFEDYFCEMSFPSYSNLPEYYNLITNENKMTIFYMPEQLEYDIPLESGAIRYDSTGLASFPLNMEDSDRYFREGKFPWDLMVTAERGGGSGGLFFDEQNNQIVFKGSFAGTYMIVPIQQLELHKPYPVRKTDDSLYAYVDIDGKLITDFLYEQAEDFSDEIAACCKNGKWGYIDIAGKEVTEFIYDASWKLENIYGINDRQISYPCTSDTMVVSKEGELGVLYRDGTLLIDYGQFEDLAPAWNNQLWAKKDGKWGFVDLAEVKRKVGLSDLFPIDEGIDNKKLTGVEELSEAAAEWSIQRIDKSVKDEDGNILLKVYYDLIYTEKMSEPCKNINALLKNKYDDFMREYGDLEKLQEYDISLASPEFPYLSTMDSEITYINEDYLSVRWTQNWCMGGVWNTDYSGEVFSLKTGEPVDIQELCLHDENDTLAYLKSTILEYIKDRPEIIWWDHVPDEIEKYTLEDFVFYLEEGSIVLCFETYLLGPGASGSFEIPCELFN